MSSTTKLSEIFPGLDDLLEETKEKIWSVHFVGEARGYIRGFFLGNKSVKNTSYNKRHIIYIKNGDLIIEEIAENIVDIAFGKSDIFIPEDYDDAMDLVQGLCGLIRNTIACLNSGDHIAEDMLILDVINKKVPEIASERAKAQKVREKV